MDTVLSQLAAETGLPEGLVGFFVGIFVASIACWAIARRAARERSPATSGFAAADRSSVSQGPTVVSSSNVVSEELSSRLLPLIRTGQKIEAIKILRAETGLGLKEAKDLIELLERTSQ